MMRTITPRTDALMGIGARPCARMHGYAWLVKQSFDVTTDTGPNNTGMASAQRLPGAPT
jgi:hypothetical protein